MDSLIATIATPWLAEALKTWGLFSTLLAGLGIALFASIRSSKSKDEDIKGLRAEIARLQDLRLQDSREMIRVAETGTATMAARSEGDARFRELMTQLVTQIATLTQPRGMTRLPPPESR